MTNGRLENRPNPAALKPSSSSLPLVRLSRSLASRTAAAPCWKALVALCRKVA
jgi:hypothetical protein